VPAYDFSLGVNPAAVSVPRGSSVVSTISLASLNNFVGTVTFSAAITNQGTDSAGLTTNITPAFAPGTVALSAGGIGAANFFATTVKGGPTPSPTDTATGNYTVTITATSGSITHTATIAVHVIDFSFGPIYCSGANPIFTTVNANFDPVLVGPVCGNQLTITTETVQQGGSDGQGAGLETGTLWMQVNSLGGFVTNGFNGNGVQGINPQLPGRGAATGVFVPELGYNVCLAQTFWANGTQIPYSYLEANGPIIAPGTGIYLPFGYNYGCRFDSGAYPYDIAAPHITKNVDFLPIAAQALNNTLPGTYTFNICALAGSLYNCQLFTLVVVKAPVFATFSFQNKVSISHGGTAKFITVLLNEDSHTLWVQATITGTGSLGHHFTVVTGVQKVNGNFFTISLSPSVKFTSSEIGETFTVTTSIAVSAFSATSLTGISTMNAFHFTFKVVA
jgi:hypothetical protein